MKIYNEINLQNLEIILPELLNKGLAFKVTPDEWGDEIFTLGIDMSSLLKVEREEIEVFINDILAEF